MRLSLLFIAACAANPSGGLPQLSLISEEDEIKLGADAAKEVEAKLPLLDDAKLTAYVQRVGREIAARSSRPKLPWRFAIIDDAMVNAFALPGGRVYVTRGILTHLGSEAELALVLGHEVAHVSARHSAHRLSQRLLLKRGFGWAPKLLPASWAEAIGGVASAGTELIFLKYGRSDEQQADELGLGYVAAAGYDARRGATVFHTLDRVSPNNGTQLEWLQSHPNPGGRYEKALARTASSSGQVREAEFVQSLSGVIFGDDPRRGTLINKRYVNPSRGFAVQFPNDWETAKKGETAAAVSPEADALAQISFADEATIEAASAAFFKDFRRTADGFEGDGVRGLVTFTQVEGKIVELVASSKASSYETRLPALQRIITSFVRIPRDLSVPIPRIIPVQLPRTMTPTEFLSTYPSVVDVRVANNLTDDPLPAGRWIKQVKHGDQAPSR